MELKPQLLAEQPLSDRYAAFIALSTTPDCLLPLVLFSLFANKDLLRLNLFIKCLQMEELVDAHWVVSCSRGKLLRHYRAGAPLLGATGAFY